MGESVLGAACEPGPELLVALVAVVVVDGGMALLERDFRSIGDDGARVRVRSPVQPRWHVISQLNEVVGEVEVGEQVEVEPHESVQGSIAGSAHPPGWR